MSGQPYSDKAWKAHLEVFERQVSSRRAALALDAAHDRERLGLDASVCARTYRAELLNEIVERLRSQQRATESVRGLDTAAELIEQWLGDQS